MAAMALKVAGGGLGALLARPLVPFFLVGGVIKMTGPKMPVLIPAALHIASLRLMVKHRITVGFVGSPSSGKDAAIKALFGVDTGNVSPIAGSTKEVQVLEVQDATALFLVNTPGMGDVVESVDLQMSNVMELMMIVMAKSMKHCARFVAVKLGHGSQEEAPVRKANG